MFGASSILMMAPALMSPGGTAAAQRCRYEDQMRFSHRDVPGETGVPMNTAVRWEKPSRGATAEAAVSLLILPKEV